MATAPAARHTAEPKVRTVESSDARLSLWIPVSAMTLEGFREWATSDDFPEHVRVAFIGNRIFLDMSNEDPECHAVVKGEIYRVLETLNRELDLGRLYPDGVLVTNSEASLSNNPDASFVSWRTLDAGRARLTRRLNDPSRYRDVEGAPDWVLEVVSDSSVGKDTERLREAYHAAGVKEYWLVDARGDELHLLILIHRKGGYAAAPNRDGWQRSRVFGQDFRLVRTRTRRNLWNYALELRAP
jgi:Uma2 family endonuclease